MYVYVYLRIYEDDWRLLCCLLFIYRSLVNIFFRRIYVYIGVVHTKNNIIYNFSYIRSMNIYFFFVFIRISYNCIFTKLLIQN